MRSISRAYATADQKLRSLAKRVVSPAMLDAVRSGKRTAVDAKRSERLAERVAGYVVRSNFSELVAPDCATPPLWRHEFRVFSQNGEDGILLYLFSAIGPTSCTFVEIGAGDGHECNTANLSVNLGWAGLLVDAAPYNVEVARRFYERRLGAGQSRVSILQRFVTAENIDEIIDDVGVAGDIDLLSIDVDGNDYWLWRSLSNLNPRVVVIEYNAGLGVERSLVTPYDPNFDRFEFDPSGAYFGASLLALHQLGEAKGYALAGVDSRRVNAFFVRRDAAADRLRMLTPGEADPYGLRLHDVAGDPRFAGFIEP